MNFDPFSPAFHQDPYPTYAWLREQAPFLWHPETQLYYVSRYEDVSALLRDRRLGRAMKSVQPLAPPRQTNGHSNA
jgi:cytochrome P450